MKTLILTLFVLCPTFLLAQCEIWGKSKLSVGDLEVYTVNKTAHCADCYSWTIPTDVFAVQGETKSKDIRLHADKVGNTTISVKVATKKGELSCSKTINISDNPQYSVNNTSGQEKKCDIEVTSLMGTKINDNEVGFSLDQPDAGFHYTWTVTYANGDQKQGNLSNPKFNNSPDNAIRTAKVVISSSKCFKEFSANYEPHFWFPKSVSAPQQSYQQGSYSEFRNKNGESEVEKQDSTVTKEAGSKP